MSELKKRKSLRKSSAKIVITDLDKIKEEAKIKAAKYDEAFKKFRKRDFWGRLVVGIFGTVVGSAGLMTIFQSYARETPAMLATNSIIVAASMVSTLYAVYNSSAKMQSTGISSARYVSLHTMTENFQDNLENGPIDTDYVECELRWIMAEIDNTSRPL